MTEDSILVVVMGVFAIAAILAASLAHLRRQRILQHGISERERTLERIIERFGSTTEFIEFARSPEAQMLFATVDAPAALARRILSLATLAIVLLALGAGLWINATQVPANADIDLLLDAIDARWWGTLAIAAGGGLGVAAWLCTSLASRWGIVGR